MKKNKQNHQKYFMVKTYIFVFLINFGNKSLMKKLKIINSKSKF